VLSFGTLTAFQVMQSKDSEAHGPVVQNINLDQNDPDLEIPFFPR